MEQTMEDWIQRFVQAVRGVFGDRVVCVGLQGRYARGEATSNSDVDVVVILDVLTLRDLLTYGEVTRELPERDKLCGFLGGKAEVAA